MGKRKQREKPYRNGNVVLGRRKTWWVADVRDEVTGKRIGRIRLIDGGPEAEARRRLDVHAEAERAVKKQQAEHTVGSLWEMWLKERERDGFSNEIYEANWVSLSPVFASRSPALLEKQDWREYAKSRFDLGRSSWTVHTELSRLKACLNWAVENRKIPEMPLWWLPSRGKPRDLTLTVDEAERLIASAVEHSDPHIYLFIVLALATGARHTAILDLKWERVDFVAGTIQYDEMLPPDPMSKSWRKGRATVPMGVLARHALEEAFAARQTDFVIEHGGRRLKTVRQGFADAVKRAGLSDKITPHTIRHTVSTWLEEKGVGIEARAKLLGHLHLETTKGYSHAKSHLTGVVEILDTALPQIPAPGRVAGRRRKQVSIDLVPVGQSGEPDDDAGSHAK